MTKFMVGTIQTGFDMEELPHKRHQLELVSELTSVEHEKLVEALKTVNGFLQDSQLFMIAAWNFREFNELVASYLQAYIEKDFNIFVHLPIHINVNRAFLNLLSSTRSYLDFMDRLLKKRFGKESAIYANFKKNCSEEYDGNFSYRFLYNLRNYAQHKGFPIGVIKWGQKQNPDEPLKIDFFLVVSIGRDEILKNFDWRTLENEVKNLPENEDILPHISSYMESLSRVHAKSINDIFQTLTESARQITIIGERLAGKKGEPVIFEFEGDVRNIQQLSHISLPIKLAQQIINGKLIDILQEIQNTVY